MFVFIAILFLCLAVASYITKSSVEESNHDAIEYLRKDIERNKKHGVKGFGSDVHYLYQTVNWHFRLEIIGFVVASVGAIVEYLLAIGWH